MVATPSYRADIDGLRALAVGLVLVFHFKLLPITGGFVGVDVFFVISGYVISRMIVQAMESPGGFSFMDFYRRRILRILPLVVVTTLFALVAGWFLLPSGEYLALARSAVATNLFLSNFYFARQAGYFMADAETYPLLHTWSLGVEEQFYILAPVAIVWLYRRAAWRPFLVASFLLSLAFALYGALADDEASYYWPHHRFFELLMGVALGTRAVTFTAEQRTRTMTAMVGVALIFAAAVFFDRATPFPGPWALVPSLGCALIILAGEGAGAANSAVTRLLSHPALVFNGRLSFALYMWHWPLLAFALLLANRPLSMMEAWGLLAVTYAVSILSYGLLERPIRAWGAASYLSSRASSVAVSGCVAATLLVVGAAQGIVATNGLPQRLPAPVVALEQSIAAAQNSAAICTRIDALGCLIGHADSKPSFVLWGDSHAAMYAAQAGLLARGADKSGYVIARGGCPPLIEVDGRNTRPARKCHDSNAALLHVLEQTPSIRHVVLAARWSLYSELEQQGGAPLRVGQMGQRSTEDARVALVSGLDQTVNRLISGGRTVTLIAPVPEHAVDVARDTMRAAMAGRRFYAVAGLADYRRDQQFVLSHLRVLATRPGVTVVYPHGALCPEAGQCLATLDDVPLYTDRNHLSGKGVELLAPMLVDAFRFPVSPVPNRSVRQ